MAFLHCAVYVYFHNLFYRLLKTWVELLGAYHSRWGCTRQKLNGTAIQRPTHILILTRFNGSNPLFQDSFYYMKNVNVDVQSWYKASTSYIACTNYGNMISIIQLMMVARWKMQKLGMNCDSWEQIFFS